MRKLALAAALAAGACAWEPAAIVGRSPGNVVVQHGVHTSPQEVLTVAQQGCAPRTAYLEMVQHPQIPDVRRSVFACR